MPPAPRRPSRTSSPKRVPYKVNYGNCPFGAIVQSRYFYAIDDAKIPITNTIDPTSIDSPVIPEQIDGIGFDPQRWQNIPRPANYHGNWPPTSASQLMNTDFTLDDMGGNRAANRFQKVYGEQVNEECLGKYCWQEAGFMGGVYCLEANCNRNFAEWLTGQKRWQDRFGTRSVPGMRYSLFSKLNPLVGWRGVWKKGDIMSVYLGELIPERTGRTEYCHEVKIGPEFEKMKTAVAYIDAGKRGNYVRFCNHSCENNAEISEVRVGKERVLALTATRRIAAGQEIVIDYGSDYFRDGQCLCGSVKCKYSSMTVMEAPKRTKPRIKKSGKIVKSRSIRHDSVLDEDGDIETETKIDCDICPCRQ